MMGSAQETRSLGAKCTFSGLGSFSCRVTTCRCWRWRARAAPAVRPYGDGSSALPRRASTGCCATRRASPARNRCRRQPWPKSRRRRAASHPDRRRTGRVAWSPRPSASACVRCSASGRQTVFSPTGSAPSRRPPIRPLHKEFIKFLNSVERAVRPGRIIHAIADNYATHKHPKSLPSRKRGLSSGSPIIRAECSISPRPPHPGSTPSRASFQSSPAGKSGAASSNLSPTSKRPSAATSESTTDPQNHSSGPNQPTPSSPTSHACLYLLNESVH